MKMIMVSGKMADLKVGTANVKAYDLSGKVLYNKDLLDANDRSIASRRLRELCRRGVVVLKKNATEPIVR
jgi:hypothetical protein